MSLTPGSRLGVYQVASQIGEGGMGQVYRATDTKLKRQVAIKVLPPSLAADHDRLARFQREAEVLASLNHPNIAAIYGLEESAGVTALVMELVEGDDLSQRIARGAIPVEEALPIAKQIADALEAAHEQGIIHRDLKPANVKVRADGTVKVLDFGLAKAMESAAGSSPSVSRSPTITTPAMMTGVGMILGTAAYMSPEQAKGRATDKRSDIWAFGCVLYEMLTAKRAFPGDDVSETLAAVIRAEPLWEALPANTPESIRRLLKRALQKDRGQRLADIADARAEIDDARETPAAAQPKLNRGRPSVTAAFGVIAAVTAILLGAASVMYWSRRSAERIDGPAIRFAIVPPEGARLGNALLSRRMALSQDGKALVYVSEDRGLFKRTLGELEISAVPGTANANARHPFVSPDGQWVGFLSPVGIRKVPLSGGPLTTVCQTPSAPTGATWTDDGRIIFAGPLDLMSVPASGGDPKPIAVQSADGNTQGLHFTFPWALPGGRGLLFEIEPVVRTPDTSQIAVLDLSSGRYTVLVRGASSPQYADGFLFYASRGSLRAVRFDPTQLRVVGEPATIVEGIRTRADVTDYTVAANGALAYVPGTGGDFSPSSSIVWVDRDGRETPIPLPRRDYGSIQLSPDGTRIALDVRDRSANSIWTWDLRRETLMRLTVDSHSNDNPVWTEDGRRIVYRSNRSTPGSLFRQNADGTGASEELSKGPVARIVKSMTADGTILFSETVRPGVVHIGMLTPASGPSGQVRMLVQTNAANNNPAVSPDGKWLAYSSDESGRTEVYVSQFPSVSEGRWQVSSAGGVMPVWSRNGRELFYLDDNRLLTSVEVQPGPAFVASQPRQLLKTRYVGTGGARSYDVSRDSQRFLVMKEDGATAESGSIVISVNWLAALKAQHGGK